VLAYQRQDLMRLSVRAMMNVKANLREDGQPRRILTLFVVVAAFVSRTKLLVIVQLQTHATTLLTAVQVEFAMSCVL
jgi:hypothetical protein